MGPVDTLMHFASQPFSQDLKNKFCDTIKAITDIGLKYFNSARSVASGYGFGPEICLAVFKSHFLGWRSIHLSCMLPSGVYVRF